MKKQRLLILVIVMCLFACIFIACDTQGSNSDHVCEFGEWTVTKRPTCTAVGERERYCSCGEKQTSSLAATGHSYAHVVTDPTCTEQGFTTHTCAGCGDSYVDTYVDALGHDEIEHVAQAPTCAEVGWDAYITCSRCNYSTYNEISTTGHSYGDWTEIKPATCTEKGLELKSCICGATVTKVIEATGHNYGAVVTPPTCTKQGFTTHTCHCGDSYVDTYVDALGHTEGEVVVENKVDAICTTNGSYDNVVYCSVCKVELSRETKTVDALGHDEIEHIAQAPTCTEIGWDAYVTCSRCDYSTYNEIPATGHTDGEWIIDVEPDCITRGRKHQVCATCGETLSIEISDFKHIYNNACDGECNECENKRTPAVHVYDSAKDEDCNECGEIRIIFEHLQEVDYWYSNTDVVMTMVGYVVEIATEYSSIYQNVSLYIVDEDFCAGYYLYRVKCDDITAAQLVPGAPVIVTGTMNTNYNGLIETNSGGTIKIDSGRTAVNVREHVYAIDNEIIGGLFSANYHQSSLVSLTNWTVKEVKPAASAVSSTETLFILTKGGVDVPVIVSKYHEGSYKRVAGDTVWEGLVNHGVQVGDIVSITGLLSNYKGHQIALLSASDIVKGGTADAEGTVYPGKTAKTAVDAIDALLESNGLTAPIVAVEKAIALPIVDGVEISARVIGNSRALSVEDGAIIVTPGKLESSCVRFDVAVGNFTTSIFRYIKTEDLDDADKLATEKDAFEIELTEVVINSEIELPTTGTLFGDIAIAWSFKADTTHDCATLDGAKLTVTLPKEATTITLVATLSLGEATPVTKEFTLSVAKAEAKILVTADVLGLGNYADGNGVIDGVGFAYVELGDYDFGIQMRNKSAEGGKQSKIANTTALGTGIAKIVITLHSGKSTYDNADAFAFRFGTSASDLTAQVIMLSTVKGQFEYTITPDAQTYTFFSMEDALTYSFFIESIQIYYNGEIEVVECDHAYNNACDAKCNKCGATRIVGDHVDEGTKNCVCDNCGTAIDHVDADSNCVCDNCAKAFDHIDVDRNGACDTCGTSMKTRELVNKVAGAYPSTIPAILELGTLKGHNTYTEEKYLVIGYVDEVYNTTYGHMYIVDAKGNKLTIYGTYNNDGSTRYDAMTTKPVACDVVVIYGVVGQYNGTPQIKNGWIMQINDTVLGNVPAPECAEHTDTNTDNKCDNCGADLTPVVEPTIVSTPVNNTEYYFMLTHTNKNNINLFITGEMNGYYYATTVDVASAVKVKVIDLGEGKYNLMVGEKYLDIIANGAHTDVVYVDAQPAKAFTWNAEYKTFVANVDGTDYIYGTSATNTYLTFSANKLEKAASTCVAHLVEVAGSEPACEHEYDNVCDADCNRCGEARTPADHVYDNACDADCNLCGTTRTVGNHVDENPVDNKCDVCGGVADINLTFALNSDGESYTITDANTNLSGNITIPSTYNGKPITTIGEYAFKDCDSLTSIVIPASVTTVSNGAFEYCDSLTSVTFGENSQLTTIGSSAFFKCISLTSIDIPDGVTTIGRATFNSCQSLTSIIIPNSVTTIDSNNFYGCSDLKYNIYDNAKYLGNETNPYLVLVMATSTAFTSCKIEENCKIIYEAAFSSCSSLTSIDIPDSVTTIGGAAFYQCVRLTSIEIPKGVTSISDSTFYNCQSLTSIVIPDSVTSIGIGAFDNCISLTAITIPDSVTSIGERAFYNCYSLTCVTFEDPNGWYITQTEGATSGANLTLTNTSTTNATYLKDTYCYYYWYKG